MKQVLTLIFTRFQSAVGGLNCVCLLYILPKEFLEMLPIHLLLLIFFFPVCFTFSFIFLCKTCIFFIHLTLAACFNQVSILE